MEEPTDGEGGKVASLLAFAILRSRLVVPVVQPGGDAGVDTQREPTELANPRVACTCSKLRKPSVPGRSPEL